MKVLMALSPPSRALEAVFRARGFSVERCEPAEMCERATAERPALVALDPFSEPAGWARLYGWRRDASLAHTEVLLVHAGSGRDEAPLGDASFLARPLGRADLDTRVRALLAGRDRVERALVVAEDDSCRRLADVLSAHGVAVERVSRPDELGSGVAGRFQLVFLPLVFAGLGVERLLELVRPGGEGPSLVFLLGPGDGDDERVTGVGARLSVPAFPPLAGTIDALIGRAQRVCEAHDGPPLRGVLPLRVFLAVFERVADYATRHGRRLLVMRVGFTGGADAGPVTEELWQALASELAGRVRLHDPVSRHASGVLALLVDATPDNLPRIQRAILEPVHRHLADRRGRPLPPFAISVFDCPQEARDAASLLARLA